MGRKPFQSWARTVWKRLSKELGGDYLSDLDWRDDRIIAKVDDWTVTIDLHQEYAPNRIYTRIFAPYRNADGFHFNIYHQGFKQNLAKFFSVKGAPHLSLQDIEVGEPALDEMFVIQASDVVEVKRLLSNPKISHGLKAEPDAHLRARHLETYPEDVDILSLEVPGQVDSLTRLENLYGLFAEVLHTLCHIGSAYEDDPNLVLNHQAFVERKPRP